MPEKWNLHRRQHGDEVPNSEVQAKIDEAVNKPDVLWDKVQKLEKTERELEIIGGINKALEEYLDFMGLDPLSVSAEDIFIVDEKKYREHAPPGQDAHLATVGEQSRIIMPRYNDENYFIQVLSHEMVHAVAYRRSRLFVNINSENNTFRYDMSSPRSGYHFNTQTASQFTGLNELMTEFIAFKVRERFFEKNNDLEKTYTLSKMQCYLVEFDIIHNLLQRYKKLGNDEQALMVELQQGYFLGDMRQLKKFQIIHPDIVRLLRDMRASDPVALMEVAKILEMEDVVERIQKIEDSAK